MTVSIILLIVILFVLLKEMSIYTHCISISTAHVLLVVVVYFTPI